MTNTYQKIKVKGKGGPEVLHVEESNFSNLSANKLLIKVHYAGMAFGDQMRRMGVLAPPWSFTPGYDIVGIIENCGSNCDPELQGKKVAAIMPMVGMGGYSEYVSLLPSQVILLNDETELPTVLALGLNYISAYQMLTRLTEVKNGDEIFIHGISGNVGKAVLDLSKMMGFKVSGTCSKKNFDFVKDNGGHPIDYREENWKESHLGRYDIVLDSLGGDNLNLSKDLLKPKGELVFFGLTGDAKKGFVASLINLIKLVFLKLTFWRLKIYAFASLPQTSLKKCLLDWKSLLSFHREGKLEPLVGKIYSFKDVRTAHKDMDEGSIRGKLILDFNSDQ